MPLIKIEIETGKSKEYKAQLLDIIHQTLVNCIQIPENDRRQRLYELEKENFEKIGRSADYTIIEITLFKGRSMEAKRKLYKQLTEKLHLQLHIPIMDITIVLNEIPLENWGIRGGYPASELDLDFKPSV